MKTEVGLLAFYLVSHLSEVMYFIGVSLTNQVPATPQPVLAGLLCDV